MLILFRVLGDFFFLLAEVRLSSPCSSGPEHSSLLAGFPPIPGQKAADAGQGFVAALMAVDKLISNENVEAADEDDDEEEVGGPCLSI